jgi:hypothetical protein
VKSLLSIASPALPSGQSPKASYVHNSLAEKQSCNSTTFISFGEKPVFLYTSYEQSLVMSLPINLMDDLSLKVDAVSVHIDIPAISTA